jgi:hypothetical protein
VKSLFVIIAHCLEIFWQEISVRVLRNAPLKIRYTPQLCIVQDKPPYQDSLLPDDVPENWW